MEFAIAQLREKRLQNLTAKRVATRDVQMSLIKEQVLDLQDKFDLFILNMMKNGSMDQGIGGEEQKQPVKVDGKEGQKLVSEYRKKAYMQDLGGRKRHRVELEKVEGD